MRYRSILLSTLLLSLAAPGLALASSGDLGAIIESFVSRHFPDATSHLWIINSAQWDGDEMVVDVDTVVVEKQRLSIESRDLLLTVKGELAATQQSPLENGPDCQPEET